MTMKEVESRLTEMEKQIAELRTLVNGRGQPQEKDWLSTFGMFSGDEMAKRIDAYALRYRERDRQKARAKASARRPRKSKANA
jgi:hypothetical protein